MLVRTLFLILYFFIGSVSWSQEACLDLFSVQTSKNFEAIELKKEVENHRAMIKILNGPEEAFLAKILSIRQAKASIDIAVYSLFKDETGLVYLSELQKALGRGVKVRLLVDSLGSFRFMHTELQHLVDSAPANNKPEIKMANLSFHPSISFARFMSLLKGETSFLNWLFAINHRLHDKLLLVDTRTPDAVMIMGSANMSNASTGIKPDGKEAPKEIEVVIRPLTQGLSDQAALEESRPDELATVSVDDELNAYFETAYEYMGNYQLGYSPKAQGSSALQRQYDAARSYADSHIQLEKILLKMAQEDFLNQGFSASDFELVHEMPNIIRKNNVFSMKWFRWGKSVNEKSVLRSISKRMIRAKEKVQIVAPYFLISDKDIQKIQKWMLSNPQVELCIYVNYFGALDHQVAGAVFENIVGPKLFEIKKNPVIGDRLKLKVYMGQPPEGLKPNFFHMKLVRIDDEFWIGSHNLDYRSAAWNSEVGAWLNSTEGLSKVDEEIKKIDTNSIDWGSKEWTAIVDKSSEFSFCRFLAKIGSFLNLHLLL